MSNEQATATYITSTFEILSKNQIESNKALTTAINELKNDNNEKVGETNRHLKDIVDKVDKIEKVLYLHDTRLTTNSQDIEELDKSISSIKNDVAVIKKKIWVAGTLGLIGVFSSATAVAENFGVKVPLAPIIQWFIDQLKGL